MWSLWLCQLLQGQVYCSSKSTHKLVQVFSSSTCMSIFCILKRANVNKLMEFNKDENTVKLLLLSDTVSKYVTHYGSRSVFLYCNQATLPYHTWPTYWSDHDLIVMIYWLCLILCQVFMTTLLSQLPYNLSSQYLVHTLIMVGTCRLDRCHVTLSLFSWSNDFIKFMSSFRD